MGVSLEVWRQRIGSFHPPNSKASNTEVKFASTSWRLGIGGSTFFVILITATLGNLILQTYLPQRCNILALCGDVELNPGPSCPLLTEDFLQNLLTADPTTIQPLQDGLRNKHIIQLYQLKDKRHCTWDIATGWLKLLIADFPSDNNVNWSRNIADNWKKLKQMKRRLQSDKNKSDELNNKFLSWEDEMYKLPSVRGQIAPTEAVQIVTKFELDCVQAENKQLQKDIQEAKDEIKRLTQQLVVLKERQSPHSQHKQDRREMRKNTQIKMLQSTSKSQEHSLKKVSEKFDKTKNVKRKLSSEFKTMATKLIRIEEEEDLKKVEYTLAVEDNLAKAQKKVQELSEELLQCKEANALLLDATIMWRSKLADVENQKLILMEKGAFNSNTRKCVYELLGCHVAQEKIPTVIESVMKLAQKKFDQIPQSGTIRNMNKEMVIVSQIQLETLANSNNLSLQSDETPKFGECYESFIADDDDGNSYLLGMRHMVDKSAQTCLNTLKDILNDINDTCLTMGKTHVGYKILTKISSTMSDRAKTEAKFHRLVDAYRREIVPLYHDQWDTLSEDAKSNLQNLYQFFCGLHLMVGMADVVNATLSKFEKLHHDTVEGLDDAETEDDKKLSESIIVRCVRTICKALARGADPKSGKHKEWRVHCSSIGHSEYVSMLQTFKGNRFNIIFLLGGNLFFLHEEVTKCLMEVPEPKNKLIRVCINLIKSKLNIAGCKALGLLRKFLMMPLWRVTEEKGHILDMNQHYHKITNFIDTCTGEENTNNMFKFMRGQYFPLNSSLIEHDVVLDSLITPDDNDTLVCGMLQSCFTALNIYLKHTVAEHLPGGKYWDANPELREATVSAPRHNKNPERVFGLLDFLCRHRPNSTTMSNEAILMFIYNHTSAFLNSKSQTELDALILSVKLRTPGIVNQYKERERVILQAHLEQKQIRANQERQRRTNVLKKKTALTDLIVNEGLWQTREYVHERLSRGDLSEAQRRKALSWQLQFRRDVLGQYYKDSKVYTLSQKVGSKQVFKSSEELKNQLLTLIDDAASVEGTSVVRSNKEKDKCTLLTGKHVKHTFSDGIVYVGNIIGPVPGFPEWFNITYENDDHVYTYRLLDDMKDGNLIIIVDV